MRSWTSRCRSNAAQRSNQRQSKRLHRVCWKSDSKHPFWFDAMVAASSWSTVCIASKHAGHWAKRRLIPRPGPEALRPRSAESRLRRIRKARPSRWRGWDVAFAAQYVTDPNKHQPCRSAGTRSFAHGTASFAKSTSMAGHAGFCVNSQLTLRVNYLMKTNQCRGEDRYWDSSS